MPAIPPTQSRSFSIIVPLYNEQDNVAPLIESILDVVVSDPAFLELVLIDDGSRDYTARLVTAYATRDRRIRLVQHETNRGLGAGIRTGLKSAQGDYVLYTDADLPFDFNLIPQLISLGLPNQLVTGYRLNRGEGPRRWVLTKTYNLLIHLLFGLRVRDVNFACKVIPQNLARNVELYSEGSFIDAEILLEAQRRGMSIREFPLIYFPRTQGQSTLSRPAVVLGILREMGSYFLRAAQAAGEARWRARSGAFGGAETVGKAAAEEAKV